MRRKREANPSAGSFPSLREVSHADGRKLPFHHRQRVFANGTLLVQATTVQDAGQYTCVATNDEGQLASASLHVAVKVPPLIERFAFDEHLHEGMRTRVYCNIARGDPPVSIAWLRDGRPLKSGPDIEVRVLDAFSVALAIESLSPRHDGRYTCLASNAAATVNYTAPLRVHVPPHWIKEPVDTSAVEGHSASMDCVADGHPTPRVTWQRGIVPARFSESYRNQTVQRGQNVGLECRAVGDAPISISWSRNGRRLDTHKLCVPPVPFRPFLLSPYFPRSVTRLFSAFGPGSLPLHPRRSQSSAQRRGPCLRGEWGRGADEKGREGRGKAREKCPSAANFRAIFPRVGVARNCAPAAGSDGGAPGSLKGAKGSAVAAKRGRAPWARRGASKKETSASRGEMPR
ncbi:hypothetical protein HPB48_004379 [Haemaphysalis longicornis]|uniref:Ig-like domain-containing protein n=1 Tax=Haemaphysalis longicornis TaxID=44386 RepID=A0A9J6G304_HAELO|nr:hypothetical protein HPB48_004379 [Haemaphysalis longicornis]